MFINENYGQPVGSLVLTPTGYKKIEDLTIGEFVCTPDGNSAKITNKSEIFKSETVEIKFNDKTSTFCSKDLLWETQDAYQRGEYKPFSLKTTSEIKSKLIKWGRKNHSIKICNGIEFSKQNLVLDPYVFGALIGDGSFRGRSIKFTTADDFLLNKIANEGTFTVTKRYGPYEYMLSTEYNIFSAHKIISYDDSNNIIKEYQNSKSAVDDGYKLIHKFVGKNKEYKGLYWKYGEYESNFPFKNYLIKTGLQNKKSEHKSIPHDYKFSSLADRISLIQGLMDTDGTVVKEACTSTEFSTSSKQLAYDFIHLIQSVGGTCKISSRIPKFTYKGVKKEGLESFRLRSAVPNNVCLFQLPRKCDLFKNRTKYFPIRYITDVIDCEEKECISIRLENNEKSYLTNDFIIIRAANK